VLAKNRERLIEGDIARKFMAAVLNRGPVLALLLAPPPGQQTRTERHRPSLSHAVPGSAEYGIADIPR
jgi:hypothetical protein